MLTKPKGILEDYTMFLKEHENTDRNISRSRSAPKASKAKAKPFSRPRYKRKAK